MVDLPSGTVTFLFTNIEGSTARWERDQVATQSAVDRRLPLLRVAVGAQGGVLTVRDAVQAAFSRAPQAIPATLAAQRPVVGEDWDEVGGLPVRMVLRQTSGFQHEGALTTPRWWRRWTPVE
jgi:hypothetical protein